jgi:ABC-type glycerol-3-phosphate transport system permease component
MKARKFLASIWVDALSLLVIGVIFVVPFAFILVIAAKTRAEAALFQFTWPSQPQQYCVLATIGWCAPCGTAHS